MMDNNEYIWDNNCTMDNFHLQNFYNSSVETNYSKSIDPYFTSINEKDSRYIYYKEEKETKNNYNYQNQSSFYYSQPSNLCNQWIENTNIENVKNKNILENKDFYYHNIPTTSQTSIIESLNTENVKEIYPDNFYSTNQMVQSNFQPNNSLSSNELSLKSTPSPLNENNINLETLPSHPGMLYFMPTLIRNSKKEKKYITPKSSKERISKKPSMHVNSSCITCGTTETTLWRRDVNGFPECNPCNLYFRTHHTKRPSRLFKNGKILKRNGKNKQLKSGFTSLPIGQDNKKNCVEKYQLNEIMNKEKINSTFDYFDNYHRNGIPESYFFV